MFRPSSGKRPTSYDGIMTAQPPEPPDTVLVEREEVAVMYRVTDDNPEAMGRAWAELEAAVGLRGRKFFGTFQPSTGEYRDRKSTRLNSSHTVISYAVFCLKKKNKQ